MTSQPPSYRGYRFPPEIISHAVWLYHRFCLSFRDVEDLLARAGHDAVVCQKSTEAFESSWHRGR